MLDQLVQLFGFIACLAPIYRRLEKPAFAFSNQVPTTRILSRFGLPMQPSGIIEYIEPIIAT